jgi:UPF0755 protein
MTTSGRNQAPRDNMRGTRQGSMTRAEANVAGYRSRRGGTSIRGVVFLLVLAIVVVGAGVLIGIPAFHSFARGLADGNTSALNYPFVGDAVRQDLGDSLIKPSGTSDAIVPFSIAPGDSVKQVAAGLSEAKLIKEPMVFIYLVVTEDVGALIKTGTFNLRQTMTPQQIVDRVQLAPEPPPPQVSIALQRGRRIEQVAASLQTMDLGMSVQAWVDYVRTPPADLIADYPWLSELPAGRSLEGFLGLGVVYQAEHAISPEDLTRLMLDQWQKDVGQTVIDQATAKKEDFYDVLTLASIVERETGVDSERAKIAGVYTNRLKGLLGGVKLLNADPTVVYATDTAALRKLDVTKWPNYLFWGLLGVTNLADVQVPADLAGYQTYVNVGLPPGPIDSPSKASILAAITPDTSGGYLFFYACPGDTKHKFAKTLADQAHNIASCK